MSVKKCKATIRKASSIYRRDPFVDSSGLSSAVTCYIRNCIICRKWSSHVVEQKMADLPEDIMEDVPPFTYCAVDLFGPFTIKEGSKILKRYGVLFTCLSSRAIHLETAIDLTTDSFINPLRRFISIRGPIRQLRCDQGTNFVGSQRELAREAQNMNQQKYNSSFKPIIAMSLSLR